MACLSFDDFIGIELSREREINYELVTQSRSTCARSEYTPLNDQSTYN